MPMVRLLFVHLLACMLVSSISVSGQSEEKDYYFAYNASLTKGGPKFMDGIFIDGHQRKVIFRNIVDVKKIPGATLAGLNAQPGDQKKPEFITFTMPALDNNDTAEAEPAHEAAKKTDTFDLFDPPVAEVKVEHPVVKPAAIKVTPPVVVTEPAKTNKAETRKVDEVVADTKTVDEVVVDMPEEVVDPVIKRYAEMINLDPSEIDNYPLYKFISKWYGTGYKWGGTDRSGIDCSAFTQKLYSAVFNTELARTSRDQHKTCEKIQHHEDAAQGDLIFFRIHRWRVSHVGVYLANGFFVHCSRSRGVVISSLDNKYWRRRYASCGKIERREVRPSESGDVD
jgi:NlpC/P60 family protein